MARAIETRSTSRRTALCNPIVLREGAHVRLAFIPAIVDNPANPNACVDGQFVYERKATSGRWEAVGSLSLTSLKEGEGFKLTLHAQELLTLLEGLVPLYRLHRDQGVPKGRKRFVELDRAVADFTSRGERELSSILQSQSDEAVGFLLSILKSLATSAERRDVVAKLASIAPEQMPTLTTLLSLASLKGAITHWQQNRNNSSEGFWQQSLAERSYVLSQVFAYPVVVIGKKAYVGGKQISNIGGKEVDFLVATESTDAVMLIEIKTPQTKLLGSEYRDGVFPLSRDLSAAVAQVLRYRQTFMRTFDSITAESTKRLTLGEPRCVVIAGQSEELTDRVMREKFELLRERIQGITIVTYDELFLRLNRLVELLEQRV